MSTPQSVSVQLRPRQCETLHRLRWPKSERLGPLRRPRDRTGRRRKDTEKESIEEIPTEGKAIEEEDKEESVKEGKEKDLEPSSLMPPVQIAYLAATIVLRSP